MMGRLRTFWRYCLTWVPWPPARAPELVIKVDCYAPQRQATPISAHDRCAQDQPPSPAPQEPPRTRQSLAVEAPCTPTITSPAALEARDDTVTSSLEPEPLPLPTIAPLNRHERRRMEKWERERRKHDVLVTPAIPPEIPPRKPRAKSDKPKAAPAETAPDLPDLPSTDRLIDGEDGKIYTEREVYGEFTFRDTILEQLGLYWTYLRRMQHHDHEAYEFYRQLGATIVPPITNFMHLGVTVDDDDDKRERDKRREIKLTPWWKEHRPSFGCVTYGISKLIEQQELQPHPRYPGKNLALWVPKFFYFTKYHRPPPKVAPMSGGDIYKLTIWWDRPFDPKYNYKKGGRPMEYAVLLTKDTIRVLPMLDTKMVSIRRKHNGAHQRRGECFDVPQRAWRIPEYYTEWAKHLGDEDAEHLLARMFMDVARTYEYSNYSMVRVAIHNGDLTAQFSIDPRRMSYFFQDRDIVYTPGGAREACFHIVRTHMRHTKHGETPVKFHFRGAKEFTWAGYRVSVTIPKRDHIPLTDFDVGMDDDYWVPRKDRKDYLTESEIGERLQHMIETGKYAFGDEDEKQQE